MKVIVSTLPQNNLLEMYNENDINLRIKIRHNDAILSLMYSKFHNEICIQMMLCKMLVVLDIFLHVIKIV